MKISTKPKAYVDTLNNEAKFDLGQILVSDQAQKTLDREFDLLPALRMHSSGHWGDQDEESWMINDRNRRSGREVKSVFYSTYGIAFRELPKTPTYAD